MATILENLDELATAKGKVLEHCMYRSSEMIGEHLYVYFPAGFSLDGVRVSLANGKAWAYRKAFEKMEQVWAEDLPQSIRKPS